MLTKAEGTYPELSSGELNRKVFLLGSGIKRIYVRFER